MQYTAAENAAITKAVPNDAMQNALSYGNSDTFKVIRRNGQVTHFDASKIETAMTKAFFDVEGTGAADSARIHERVRMLTDTVEACLFKRVPAGGVIHIEDIQDQVELALMRKGEQKVARSYVIYREKHAKLRLLKNQEVANALEPQLYVLTASGARKPLDETRLRIIVNEAVEGLSGVDGQALYNDAIRNLFDGVPETDVSSVFIMAARVMIEKDPNYSFVAARLLQDSLRREALSFLDKSNHEATLAEMQSLYGIYLEKTLIRAVELELIDPELLRYDFNKLGASLQASRDQQFTYLGLQTLYDRYFIHSGNTRFELPQIFFMRVSMGLAINEAKREERAIEFYNLLSSFDFMSSTPTLFNSGTLRPQLSSCYLTTIPDDLDGIYNGIKDNALLSKFAGGLGNDWTSVRGLGAHIKGTNGQSQGVVPFLKVANDTAVAVNQCHAPETLLWTSEGAKFIKDVKVGDLVLGKQGYYRSVLKHLKYNQTDPMVEISVRYGTHPLKITSGHPIWSYCIKRKYHTPKQIVNFLEKGETQVSYCEAGKLKKGDFVAQTIPQEIVPIKGLTEDDARLYGIMLGDGHVTKGEYEWGISVNPKTDKHLEFIKNYLKEKGIHYWIYQRNEHYLQIKWSLTTECLRDATTGQFIKSSRLNFPFEKEDLYNDLKQKHISPRFLHLPEAQTRALIQGLLETDGSVSGKKLINFTNTSRPLIEGLRYLLLRLKIPSAASYRERDNNHVGHRVDGTKIQFTGVTRAYDLRIPAVADFSEYLDYKIAEKRYWFEWDGCLFSRITNITPIDPVPFVFDLKVEGDPSYTTNAFAVSNGGKRKGAVCAYLETWHIDIEEFLELRKNTGDERRRTHDMNSANWIPDFFMKRVAEEKEWTLFSPDETPDLHDLYGKAFEAKYVEYEAKAARGEMQLSKTVAALDLWRKMLGMLFETGHPWITFKDPCNIRYSNQHVGVVHSSNLCTEIMLHTNSDEIAVCFPKGTQILTKQGQKSIEFCDQVEVFVPFNNELCPQQRFLTAKLIPQKIKQVYEVITKNGINICATEEHPFLIQHPIDHDKPKHYEWRKLKELQRGDFIVCPLTPPIYSEIGQQDIDFTAAGWMLGDGWMSTSYGACFAPHETTAQAFVLPILERWHQESPLGKNTPHSAPPTPYTQPNGVVNWHTQRKGFIDYVKDRFGFKKAKGPQKRIASQIKEAKVNQIASFLSGLFSADGCVMNDKRRKKGGVSVTLSSASLPLLRDVQLLLKPFGIHGRVRGCSVKGRESRWQGTYEIQSADAILNFVRFIGFSLTPNKQEKLQGLLPKLSNRSAFQHTAVMEIIAKGEEEVFDLSLKEDHSFIANGLVVHNCNLGSVNIAAHTKADGLDLAKMERTITTAMRMLDNVIDYNYYSVPQAKRSNSLHRPVGIGMMGFQDALYKQDIPYASEDAIEFADKSMEALSYFAIQGSNRLAVERGTYSTFEGSLWSQGILPIDSLEKLIEERGEYIQVDQSSRLDWDSLRSDIKATGMRNSNVMAIAPTACVSGDTLILSSKGLIPIESLVEGQAQWQNIHLNIVQEGNLARADQLYLNGAKETLRITTKRGSEISATPNHRIRVIDQSGDYIWKYFSELTVGDEVVRRLGGHQTLLANKELLDLTVPPCQHHNEKNIQIPEKLDKDTAFMLGLYMGDGYLKYSHRNHYTKKEGLGFALHNSEEHLLNALRAQFSKWGVTLLADLSKTDSACTTYLVFSSQLVRWFEVNKFNKQRGNFGEGSASAFIPNKILESNSEVLCAFLSGLFVADGTVNNRCVEMATASRTLAVQVKVALESLGILATLATSKPGTKGNRPVHRVRTSNVKATRLFLKYIGFGDSVKHQYLVERLASSHSESDAHRGHNIHSLAVITDFIQASRQANVNKRYLNPLACSKTNGKMNIHLAQQVIADYPELQKTKLGKLLSKGMLYFEPIISIEDSYDITYDLQVPEKHTYVANGFVSHNTISNICGVSQSIEPTYQNMFVKSNLSGEFMVINAYLVNDLKALGIWDEVMTNDLKYDDGSLQNIDRIPANLKAKYATAFEMDSRWLVEAASRRQKWIDQGQSLNLYMSEPSGAKLDNLYKLAWVRGLKTTYYLRSMGATHMEKTTERTQSIDTNTPDNGSVGSEAPKACSILDPDCDACQ